MPVAFKRQKYDEIKKPHMKTKGFYTDTEFAPTNKSLFFSKVDSEIEWRRPNEIFSVEHKGGPKELVKLPHLVVDSTDCPDLDPGVLGNAWFVSACSALAQEPKLFQKVVPNFKDQDWKHDQHHVGVFHFHIWRQGEWHDVVVDDLLPTKQGKLVFCHARNRNEFWCALLEKAYAKLYGDYESLRNGNVIDALVDFTSGVPEILLLPELKLQHEENQTNLFNHMMESFESSSLIVCQDGCAVEEVGNVTSDGLKRGHGYGVTAIKTIEIKKGLIEVIGAEKIRMVRLRNPWGTDDWRGRWSDNSKEWTNLAANERKNLGLTYSKDGEFWMIFEDLVQHFNQIGIVNFMNTTMFSTKKKWYESCLSSAWTAGARATDQDKAGGSEEHESFLRNPQFLFDVTSPVDTLLFSLQQNDSKADRKTGAGNLNIGMNIFKVEENRQYRMHVPYEKICSSKYREWRSIFFKVDLHKGRYIILPTTFHPGFENEFLLRYYAGDKTNPKELTMGCPKTSGCCVTPPMLVYVVTVMKAVGLEQKKGSTDAYAIITCESETVKTPVVKNSVNPVWGTRAIFYKKKPNSPITIQMWNKNTISDDFMGETLIVALSDETGEEKECELLGKTKKEKAINVKHQGKLFVKIQSSLDLTAL